MITLGAVAFSGIGLLLASRAQKLETVSGLMNLVMLPMWLVSGIFFSYGAPAQTGKSRGCKSRLTKE